MRLLHIIPSLRKGGAERIVLDICRELSKRPDIRCKLVVMHEQNEYPLLSEGLDIEFCQSRVVPSITGKWQVDIAYWQSIVQAFQPDVIHSHLFEAEIMSRVWLYPKAVYFSHCHDNMPQLNKLNISSLLSKKKLANYYERTYLLPCYKQVENKFIAISKDIANHFKGNLPNGLKDYIHLLPNAINFKAFYRDLPKEPPNLQIIKLISVGSLVPKKNQAFLLQVCHILQKQGLSVELNLLGDGPERAKITRLAKEMGLQKTVIMHGNVEDVPSHLYQSYIYVHAATYEPFGLVLLEAMAAGLPVVCLDGGGNRDLILQDKNGFMVNQPDPMRFAGYIKQLVEQPELYQNMSMFAQKFAADYDIGAYVDKLLRLYATAIENVNGTAPKTHRVMPG